MKTTAMMIYVVAPSICHPIDIYLQKDLDLWALFHDGRYMFSALWCDPI
jgi:hypothetical protein